MGATRGGGAAPGGRGAEVPHALAPAPATAHLPAMASGSSPLSRFAWYKRLQAWLIARAMGRYERAVEDRKRELLGPLRGRVVEIGPGVGANLRFYAPGVEWIGIEPNPFMEQRLRDEAARLGREVEVRRDAAETLPFPDGSVDAVVSTLVLCSVSDPAAALAEVCRVLKPTGRFIFIEHVAAPPGTRLRRLQRWIRPLWRFAADGCEPDRETWRTIEQAGFDDVALEHFRAPAGVVAPHIAGWAVR